MSVVIIMSLNLLGNVSFQFDYISIIILVLGLIFIIKGIIDGFFKSIISIFGGIISLVVAILLAKPIGNLLFDTNLGASLTNNINQSLVNLNPEAFNTPIPVEYQEETISSIIASFHIPGFLNGLLTKFTLNLISIETEGTLGMLIGQSLAHYIFYFIAGLIVFIVLKIIFFILKILTRKINKVPFFGKFNRFAGGVLGLVNAFVFVTVVMYGISLLMTITPVGDYFTKLLALDNSQVYSVAKWFLNNNLIQKIVDVYL